MRVLLCALLLACCLHTFVTADEISNIIFDTDIAGDVDDVLALAMLHTLADRAECRIAAVTVSKTHPLNGPMVDAINTFYGRPNLTIGLTKGNYPRDSKYLELVKTKDDAEKQSITIVQVGLAVNVADLLESPADKISPLDGKQLVQEKVKLLSIMAGAFHAVQGNIRYLEANVRSQISSMHRMVKQWPVVVPVIWSDFNIGIAAPYPRESITRDFRYRQHHIVPESYLLHSGPNHDRPTWDLTSVLVVACENGDYFHYSEPGTVEVDDDGFTRFLPNRSGNATGNHRYLTRTPEQATRVIAVQRALVSQPPRAGATQ